MVAEAIQLDGGGDTSLIAGGAESLMAGGGAYWLMPEED